jgi:hypothetical protein
MDQVVAGLDAIQVETDQHFGTANNGSQRKPRAWNPFRWVPLSRLSRLAAAQNRQVLHAGFLAWAQSSTFREPIGGSNATEKGDSLDGGFVVSSAAFLSVRGQEG